MKTRAQIFLLFITLLTPPSETRASPIDMEAERKKLESKREMLAREAAEKERTRPKANISLLSGSGIVKYHGKKNSGLAFKKSPPPIQEPTNDSATLDIPEISIASLIRELPICQKSEITEQEIASPSKENYDFIVYSFLDQDQKERADAWQGAAIPYYSAKNKTEVMSSRINGLQLIALQHGVSCLPTRVKLAEQEGRFYLQLRTGQAAWEDM